MPEEPEEAGDLAPGAEEEPNSRAAFNLLRESYQGDSARMIEDFLHDHEHHLRMRILVHTGRRLQSEYVAMLDAHKEGQLQALHWQACRAAGAWFTTVCELFALLETPEVLTSLDLRGHAANAAPAPLEEPALQRDARTATSMWNLVVELAHARSWSQLPHSITLPHAFVRVFGDECDLPRSQVTLHLLCQALSRVDRARVEVTAQNDRSSAALIAELIDDLGTFYWVLTREMLIELEQCDYDLRSQRLRELGFSVFASAAQTKSICEDGFAWLADTNKRQSTSNKMAQETKWAYLQICPYPRDGGTAMLTPPSADIRAQGADDVKAYSAQNPFTGQWRQLPFENVTRGRIKKWRPAGFFAQRRAAAACAFIMKHSSSDRGLHIDALQRAWCGDLATIYTLKSKLLNPQP